MSFSVSVPLCAIYQSCFLRSKIQTYIRHTQAKTLMSSQPSQLQNICEQRTKTRNSPGDEIANVNFFTMTSSTTFAQCALESTEFGEITQNKGYYAVQGHSRSPILVPIES